MYNNINCKSLKNIDFRKNHSLWEKIELCYRTYNNQYITILDCNFENSILPISLYHISFHDCNFRNACFENTKRFHNSFISNCDFTNANMMGIHIDESNIYNCDCTNTNFEKSHISKITEIQHCDFIDTNFKESFFDGCHFNNNIFINVDFSSVFFGSIEFNVGNKINNCNFNDSKFNEFRIDSVFTAFNLSSSSFNNTIIKNYYGPNFGKIFIELNGGDIKNHYSDNWILEEI